MKTKTFTLLFVVAISTSLLNDSKAGDSSPPGLWGLYLDVFRDAKYIDLTHAFEPVQAVWPGFGNAKFKPATAGKSIKGYVNTGEQFTYKKHGFVATAYELPTDQYGTQLDPPAHWEARGATISDIPATYAIRPLVVIDIHQQVAKNAGYHLQVADIKNVGKQAWSYSRRFCSYGAFRLAQKMV